MATTIKLKNGSGAPLAGDLVQGEPALDLTNKRLYTENASGTVIEVGTNPSTLTVDGNVGIGTSSPARNLSVVDASAPHIQLATSADQAASNGFELAFDGSANYIAGRENVPTLFYTNNIERMRIDASGNVGIGLTPSAWSTGKAVELGFQGNALWGNAADEVIVSQNAYYNSGWKYATTRAATHYSQYNAAHRWFTAPSGTANSAITWTQAMTLDSSGNVGIGTASPGARLDLVGPSSTPLVLELNSANANCDVTMQSANTSSVTRLRNGTNDFQVHTNGSERMRIDSSGNVGIGTTATANTRVYVRTALATDVAYLADNSTNSGFKVKFNSGSTAILNDFNAPLIFGTNDTERMRIDASGNVGIGTTSPSSMLHLYGTDPILRLQDSAGGDTFGVYVSNLDGFGIYNFTDSRQDLTISGDGNVGIGTTSPFSTARLQVKTGTNLNLAVQTGTTETSGMKINAFNDAGSANIPLELNGSVTLLKTGETERMRIDSSGNVSVRTTTGIGKLTGPRGNEVTVADDATVNLVINTAGACFIHAYDVGLGDGAVFFGTYKGGTTSVAAQGSNPWATSDTDGAYCIYKSGNSHTITFKNRTGASRTMIFLVTAASTV